MKRYVKTCTAETKSCLDVHLHCLVYNIMCIISLRCKQNNPYLERTFNVLSRGQFYALILAVWLLMASENAGLSVYIKIPVTPPKQTLHAQAQKSETLFTLLDLPCHSPWVLCSDRPGLPGVFFTREVVISLGRRTVSAIKRFFSGMRSFPFARYFRAPSKYKEHLTAGYHPWGKTVH